MYSTGCGVYLIQKFVESENTTQPGLELTNAMVKHLS